MKKLLPLAVLTLSMNTAHAVQVDFTGGLVTLNNGATATTNNAVTHFNVASYEEDGFLFEYFFDSTPTSFASAIGNYYGTGNDVMHWHWADGGIGEVTEVKISKVDGSAFDLGGFAVSTNTSIGGSSSTGGELVWINTSKQNEIFNIAPDNWGLGSGPDPIYTIDAANLFFDDILWFSFTNDALSTAVGMGLDNFFINEAGDSSGSDPTLSPVPVPAAFPLFATALAAFGWMRRRKQLNKEK